MPELIANAEIPVSSSEWSFDTLRVYLLRHILSLQHADEAQLVLAKSIIDQNDQRYRVMFDKVELAIVSLREVVHLKDAKYETQFKSLEAALQAQLISLRENTALAFTASEKAISKAETASEKRFESVNEFRQTLTDQAATFMQRAQVETLLGNLNEKLNLLTARVERGEGIGDGSARTKAESTTQNNWAVGLVVAVAVSLVEILLHFAKV
jgi:hypothetical protein